MSESIRAPAPAGVRLTRDEHGVPHVEAEDLLGAHWGLGYCHALDRGLQMSLMRLLGQGRATECLRDDNELLEVDRFFRKMNWKGNMGPTREALDEECRGLAEAYCHGVNARFREARPWELWLVGYEPEPWRIEDTLLLARMTGYVTLAQSQAEIERLFLEMVRAGVPDDALEALFPGNLGGLDRGLLEKVTLGERVVPEALRWLSPAPRMMASNNWVVSGARTVSGRPLMANDPHLEINRLPNIWVEQAVELPDGWWLGASMPGLPAMLVGRNAHLAWGATYSFADAVDSWVEHCRDGRYRRGEDEWIPFRQRTEVIRRKKSPEVTVTYYENDHGVLDGNPAVEGLYLATRWAPGESGAASLAAMRDMWSARTVEEGMGCLGRIESSFNWVLADDQGHIGFQMSGTIPVRHPEANAFGLHRHRQPGPERLRPRRPDQHCDGGPPRPAHRRAAGIDREGRRRDLRPHPDGRPLASGGRVHGGPAPAASRDRGREGARGVGLPVRPRLPGSGRLRDLLRRSHVRALRSRRRGGGSSVPHLGRRPLHRLLPERRPRAARRELPVARRSHP
jgi:penicillin amidase